MIFYSVLLQNFVCLLTIVSSSIIPLVFHSVVQINNDAYGVFVQHFVTLGDIIAIYTEFRCVIVSHFEWHVTDADLLLLTYSKYRL